MRIRFLRESGGHGDVVRCLGTVASVREAIPDAELWFYTVGIYEQWAYLSLDVDRVVRPLWDERTRGECRKRDETPNPRKRPYLARHGRFDATVDMYDPAFKHERETTGAVFLDRIDCWTGHAAATLGVCLHPRLARFSPDGYSRGWVDGWLHSVGATHGPLVVIQPLSVDPRRSLSPMQTMSCIETLRDAGACVVLVHVRLGVAGMKRGTPRFRLENTILRWAHREHLPMFVSPNMSRLAALVGAASCVLTGDSALLHVAAAMERPSVSLFGVTRGDIICKHYPLATYVDAGRRERAGCWCAESGIGCYGFPRKIDGHWHRPCRGVGCPAAWRVSPVKLAEKVLQCLSRQ